MLHKISGRDLQYQFPIAKIFIHSLFSLNIEVLQMFPSYFEADRIFIGPSIFIKYVFTSLSMSWLTLVSWYLNSSISCLFMEDIEFKTFYEGYIIPKKCQMNAYIVNNFQEVGSLVISIKFSIWNVRKTVSRIPVSFDYERTCWRGWGVWLADWLSSLIWFRLLRLKQKPAYSGLAWLGPWYDFDYRIKKTWLSLITG